MQDKSALQKDGEYVVVVIKETSPTSFRYRYQTGDVKRDWEAKYFEANGVPLKNGDRFLGIASPSSTSSHLVLFDKRIGENDNIDSLLKVEVDKSYLKEKMDESYMFEM